MGTSATERVRVGCPCRLSRYGLARLRAGIFADERRFFSRRRRGEVLPLPRLLAPPFSAFLAAVRRCAWRFRAAGHRPRPCFRARRFATELVHQRRPPPTMMALPAWVAPRSIPLGAPRRTARHLSALRPPSSWPTTSRSSSNASNLRERNWRNRRGNRRSAWPLGEAPSMGEPAALALIASRPLSVAPSEVHLPDDSSIVARISASAHRQASESARPDLSRSREYRGEIPTLSARSRMFERSAALSSLRPSSLS